MDTFFTDYKILENQSCNVLCDQIMSNIRIQFPEKESSFVVSGRLAYNLQDKENVAIRNIVFITNDVEIFEHHRKYARTISNSATGIINFKERTLIYFENLFIEIWLSDEVIDTVMINRLPVQEKNQIPNSTL